MTGMLLGPDALFLGILASFVMICTSFQDTHTRISHSSAEIICILLVLILVGMAVSILCEYMYEYIRAKKQNNHINKCTSD